MKTLTYNRLNRQGRLGNMLFFLSGAFGLAKRSGRTLSLPYWKGYQHVFKWNKDIIEKDYGKAVEIGETDFHYCGEHFQEHLKGEEELIHITGYLQSEKYFKEYETEIRDMFQFKEEFVALVMENMEEVFKKPVICIHIRRGDYIGNENYYQLPLNYYILALEEHFPDWMENHNILVFSDDIKWCKTYLVGENIFYSDNRSDIEDLCLASKCTHFILSNSSYSWWMAYLSNTKGKIIRPVHMFAGYLAKSNNIKDFWPDMWISFDHEEKKLDFTDVDFLIPVHFDHRDRWINVNRVLNYLEQNLDTNIIVGEQGGTHFADSFPRYIEFTEMETFHRTRMLNQMCRYGKGNVMVNYDADVIVNIIQLLQAVKLLRKGEAAVFPYDGRFARIHKNDQWMDFENMDVTMMKGSRSMDPVSVGGCIMFRKDAFYELGMENENFISYGPEDTERVERIEKLGIEIKRIKGILYHYDHYTGPNSTGNNPHFGANCAELDKIQRMTKQELRKYIDSWEWCKRKQEV